MPGVHEGYVSSDQMDEERIKRGQEASERERKAGVLAVGIALTCRSHEPEVRLNALIQMLANEIVAGSEAEDLDHNVYQVIKGLQERVQITEEGYDRTAE